MYYTLLIVAHYEIAGKIAHNIVGPKYLSALIRTIIINVLHV